MSIIIYSREELKLLVSDLVTYRANQKHLQKNIEPLLKEQIILSTPRM